MKNSLLVSLAALPLALCALNLSDKSDIRFAEAYAFSTNRLTPRPRDASPTPTPC